MTNIKLSVLVSLLLMVVTPAFAQQIQTQDGLSITLGREGSVASVTTGGKGWQLAKDGGSGLLMRDAGANGKFMAAGGVLANREGAIAQNGINEALKLKFEAVYRALPNVIQVSGFIQDISGQDRAVTVRAPAPSARRRLVTTRRAARAGPAC